MRNDSYNRPTLVHNAVNKPLHSTFNLTWPIFTELLHLGHVKAIYYTDQLPFPSCNIVQAFKVYLSISKYLIEQYNH